MDFYAPFAIDPENGMYLCPCGKEADEDIPKEMYYYVCGECVVCHHCDKRTPKGDDFPECEHCGMYLDLVCIKGKMVPRYTPTGKDRIARHEKS